MIQVFLQILLSVRNHKHTVSFRNKAYIVVSCVFTCAEARILQELDELREARNQMETDREEMVKRIKTLQSKSSNRRNQGTKIHLKLWMIKILQIQCHVFQNF